METMTVTLVDIVDPSGVVVAGIPVTESHKYMSPDSYANGRRIRAHVKAAPVSPLASVVAAINPPPVVGGTIPVSAPVVTPVPVARTATPSEASRLASDAELAMVRQLRMLDSQIEGLELQAKALKADLLKSIGQGEIDLGTEGRALVVAMAGRRTLDNEKLRTEHPELVPVLDAYTKQGDPSAYVRLFDTKKKGKK